MKGRGMPFLYTIIKVTGGTFCEKRNLTGDTFPDAVSADRLSGGYAPER